MIPAVFPMFQRLVLPFKLFLKIFLGLLYCMFTFICQRYRSFPLALFRQDFSFLNLPCCFLGTPLPAGSACCTCVNEKSNVFQCGHPSKRSLGCTCLNEKVWWMHISDVLRVRAGGREQLCQTALKTRSKPALDVHIYWSQQIHVTHNFGLGWPDASLGTTFCQSSICPPHSSLGAPVNVLFFFAHLELDTSSPTAA